MDPTPYCEAVSTSMAPPCRTTLDGPRTKSWWNCATGIRRAWTRPPVLSAGSKITRSGTASRIRAITARSTTTPRRRDGLGRRPGPRRAKATHAAAAATSPSPSATGLIDSTTVKASSAHSRKAPVTVHRSVARGASRSIASQGRGRSARHRAAAAATHHSDTAASVSTSPPSGTRCAATRAAASVSASNAVSDASPAPLGEVEIESARRGTHQSASGRMTPKLSR